MVGKTKIYLCNIEHRHESNIFMRWRYIKTNFTCTCEWKLTLSDISRWEQRVSRQVTGRDNICFFRSDLTNKKTRNQRTLIVRIAGLSRLAKCFKVSRYGWAVLVDIAVERPHSGEKPRLCTKCRDIYSNILGNHLQPFLLVYKDFKILRIKQNCNLSLVF